MMRDIYRIARRVYRHYSTSQDIVSPDFTGCDLTPVLSQLSCCAPPSAGSLPDTGG